MRTRKVTAERAGMIEVLERVVVQSLTQRGFAGAFPHYRRITPDRVDVLSVFFNPYGTGFVFKFGRCGPGGFVKQNGKRVPAEKVTTSDMLYLQLAWISPDFRATGADFWFQYDPSDPASMRAAAERALPYLLQLDF